MGAYSFIFGCIGIGILLWVLTGIFSENNFLSSATIELIGEAGTIMFIIGLGSLAVKFLISLVLGRSVLSH